MNGGHVPSHPIAFYMEVHPNRNKTRFIRNGLKKGEEFLQACLSKQYDVMMAQDEETEPEKGKEEDNRWRS